MSASPPPRASPTSPATAHAYASNGLEILQAASDAAHAVSGAQSQGQIPTDVDAEALQHAAAEAVAEQQQQQQHGQHDDHQQQQLNAQGELPGAQPSQAELDEALRLVALGSGNAMRDPTFNPKLTRLRRACDMCSARKVKCDDTEIPCRPCRELGVDCTYNRQTKRRGPPNKHAEAAKAAKRARLEPGSAVLPESPTPQIAAKTLMNISSDGMLDAETIAPMPVLELLVDDFFTYIYPLAPFPHEPTFRQSFANREDRSRPEFLGLLASMVCVLVASFPRSVREHLKAQHSADLFPRSSAMAEKCRDIALLTRGSKWVLKQPKTLDDAATSYFLGLAAGYAQQWHASRHFMAETLTLIRELGFSRPQRHGDLPTFGSDTSSPDSLPFNHVKDQIGKRIFWCLLLGVRSFSQLGSSQTDIVIPPSTPNLPYPSYPENVDDICVLANEIIHQPDTSLTLLTGFRYAIDIYTTMNGVVSLELAYGISTLPWTDQRILLRDGLLAAKSIVETLPHELQLGTHADTDANGMATAIDESGAQYVPSLWPNPQPPHDLRNIIKAQPQRRRQLQHEIQRANIFVSQLATRSYFVELYFHLRDVHLAEQQQNDGSNGQATSDEDKALQEVEEKEILDLMASERDLLVQNLLHVLGSISQRTLEPHSGSLITKIRSVASTLLNDPPERKSSFAVKSEDSLSQLVDVLLRLEVSGHAGGDMTAQDEEQEARHWSDLREYQLRYAANGAFEGEAVPEAA